MGLTQVSTDGVKNDAITKTKIPANQIEASELADNAVDTNAISNNAVTFDKIQDLAQDKLLGRVSSGTGDIQGLSAANVRSIINVADGATNSTSTTINNNADNRLITGSGTANTLEGEANLTFDGTQLNVTPTLFGSGNVSKTQDGVIIQRNSSSGTAEIVAGRSGGNYGGIEHYVAGASGVTKRHQIDYQSNFSWYGADGTTQQMKLDSAGRLKINHTDHPGQLDNTFISIHDTNGGGGISKNYAMMQVNNYGTGNTGDLSGIGFGAGAGNAYIKGSIGFIRTSGYGQGDFTFNLNSDNSSALVNDTDELVRIQKGGGISFNGDTAAANALDDYEEGTWTPSIYYQNTSGLTISTNSYGGKYTKVGRVVYVLGYINWSVSGSPINDNVAILGLPFSTDPGKISAGGTRFIGNISLEGTNSESTTHQVEPYGNNGANIITDNEKGNKSNELGGNSNMYLKVQFWYHSS